MDINQLVRDSYKLSATAMVDEQFQVPEPDYSARHVEALEQIAQNSLDRLKAAEQNLEALREISDSLKQRVKVAEEDADRAKKDSRAATIQGRIAIAVSALTFLFQFMPQISGIISQWIK